MTSHGIVRRGVVRAGLVLCALAAGAAQAHHSFALFDHNNKVTVTGTVTKFDWTNPHVFIVLAVPDGSNTKQYTVECASPNVLTRVGWKYSDIKVGDKVTLLVNPLRSGEHGGAFVSIKLPDGRVLGDKWTEDIESKGVVK